MPKITKCQIRDGARWQTMKIEDALTQRGLEMRCPECHGKVRAHQEGTTGQAAHFEHSQSHDGCSLSGAWNGKNRREHPSPIL